MWEPVDGVAGREERAIISVSNGCLNWRYLILVLERALTNADVDTESGVAAVTT